MKKELLQYVPIAKFLKDALGERYRIVLVDADDLSREITISENGFSENERKDMVEAGILSDIINSTELKKRDYLCSFASPRNAIEKDAAENNATEKTSIFYIRNEKKEISGFLCVYENRGDLYRVSEVLDQLLLPEGQTQNAFGDIEAEVNSQLKERIVRVWNRYNPSDKKIKKSEKIAFVSELFEMGIFRMKGGAVLVSEVTGISLASVYRYFSEVLEE